MAPDLDLTYQTNLASFRKWPHSSPSKYQMAAAGFRLMRCHSSSTTDEAICTSCMIQLNDWQYNDVPIEEHITRSPRCSFAWGMHEKFSQTPKATTTAATSISPLSLAPLALPSLQQSPQRQCQQDEMQLRSCMRRRSSSSTEKTVKFAAWTGVKIIENTSEILTQQSIIQQYPSPPSPPPPAPSATPSRQSEAEFDEKPSHAPPAPPAATPLHAAPPSPPLSPELAPTKPEKHSQPPTVLPLSPPPSPTPVSPQKCAKISEIRPPRPSKIPRPVPAAASPVFSTKLVETAAATSPATSAAPAAAAPSRLSPHAAPFSPRFAPQTHEMPPQRLYVPPHRRPYMTIQELFKKFGSSWSRAACSIHKQSIILQCSNASELARSDASRPNCAKVNSATSQPHSLPPRPLHPMKLFHQVTKPSYWPTTFLSIPWAARKSMENTLLQLLGELRHIHYGPRIV